LHICDYGSGSAEAAFELPRTASLLDLVVEVAADFVD